MIYIYFASFFTLDPWGNDYIQVPKTDKMYLNESQAQKACDKGCIPIAVQLPEGYNIAPSWVIERGYDDCEFDDGHNYNPEDYANPGDITLKLYESGKIVYTRYWGIEYPLNRQFLDVTNHQGMFDDDKVEEFSWKNSDKEISLSDILGLN